MSSALWCLVLAWAAAPPVETSAEATTHLYVRTTPSGAQILLDGKELGTSPGVFPVKPGQRRRLVIELDGRVAKDQQITIRDGRITRLELTLTPPDTNVESRSVGKKVSDFPEPVDLSTPESACAADYRFSGSSDGATMQDLCWEISDPEKRKQISTVGRSGIRTAGWKAELEAAEILEVLNYGEDFAAVISRRSSPPDKARNMLSLKTFGRIDHEWKLVSRVPSGASLETATSTFLEEKDRLLQRFQETRKALAADQMTDVESRSVGKDVQSRSVGKKVSDFPEPVDLSSPETACAAFHRASAAMDVDAVVDLCWVTVFPDIDMKVTWTLSKADDLADYNKAQLDAEILEVLSYGEELAAVVSRLEFPPGVSRHPISLRTFGRIDGEWKNLGEDRCSSLEVATTIFSQSADRHWQRFLNIRDARAAVLVAAPGFAWKPLPDARQPLAFGPVIECVVNDAGNSLIDFDTGKVLSPPVKENLAGKSLTEWLVEAGVDAAGGPRFSVSGLRGIDMRVMPISSEKWDQISRNDVPRGMMGGRRLGRLIHISGKGDLPATFFFNTREGGMGLLQILEFTEEPKGVKIRYKLVESGERKRDVVILTFEVDRDSVPGDKPVDIDDLLSAIGHRLDRGWVGRTHVRQVGTQQIEVVASTTDPEHVRRIERLVQSPGTIELRILANDRDHKEIIDRALKEDDPRVLNPDGSLAAWWVPVAPGQEANSRIYPGIAIREIQEDDPETSEVLVVEDPFDVTDAYLVEATSAVDSSGRPCVGFTFDSRGGQLLGGLTAANLPDKSGNFSRHLGIILNGQLHSAPAIRSTIHEQGEITGDFTREEVEDLVNVLNTGPLPMPLEKVSEVRTSQ